MNEGTSELSEFSEEIQKEELRAELWKELQDEYGFKLEPRTMPGETDEQYSPVFINYVAFGDTAPVIKTEVERLDTFLGGTFYSDKIKTHEERREIRKTLIAKYADTLGKDEVEKYFHDNKMSYNGTNKVYRAIMTLRMQFDKDPRLNRLNPELKEIVMAGPSFSDEDRKDVRKTIKGVEKVAYLVKLKLSETAEKIRSAGVR